MAVARLSPFEGCQLRYSLLEHTGAKSSVTRIVVKSFITPLMEADSEPRLFAVCHVIPFGFPWLDLRQQFQEESTSERFSLTFREGKNETSISDTLRLEEISDATPYRRKPVTGSLSPTTC